MPEKSCLIQKLRTTFLHGIATKMKLRKLKLTLYLKKTAKYLSIEIKFCLLIGQIDKFRRRLKYHLLS